MVVVQLFWCVIYSYLLQAQGKGMLLIISFGNLDVLQGYICNL